MNRICFSVPGLTVGVGLTFVLAGCATNPPAKGDSRSESQAQSAASIPSAAAPKPPQSAAPVKEPTGALTLRDALALALTENPELAPFAWQARVNEARILQAGLRLNPELGLQVEDVLGTGDFSGGQEAQITLQLSQVIELGGKRAARTELASQARGVTRSAYELKRVEVLGEVAQRFIQVVANQHALDLALTNRQLAADALRTVRERVTAGKGSALEERKAQVALARGDVLVGSARYVLETSRKKLAASWRSKQPVFERAQADLFARKPVPAFEGLVERISSSPEITRWVSEKKLREAEIKLADARRVPNVTVGGGIRHLQGSDDQALVFGFSMPLQFFDRNQGGTAEARALLSRTEAEHKAAEIRLGTVLLGLYQEMAWAVQVMDGLQKEIVPKAEDALAISWEGFAQGRFSYLEVLDAQRTMFDIKLEYIQTATAYHQFIVELERLIGQPIEGGEPQR
ncbi:MAG: TolC family protein [Verrucomicrobiales bacterium]|nr:TolC family protein [Verrucomicrobiales bacterium]